MIQHCNIQNNITIKHNKAQKNVVTYTHYCNSTKQHNKLQNIVITYKTVSQYYEPTYQDTKKCCDNLKQ